MLTMDFFKRLFGNKGTVGGLDLGSSSLKLIQLKPIKDKTKGKLYELSSFVMGLPPEETVKEGVINDPKALGELLKQLIQSHKINIEQVVGVVSGQPVIIRPIIMPKLPEKEMQSSLRFQAEQYLPYRADEAMIRGTILNKELEDNPGSMEVLLVAAPNEIVKNTQDVIRFSGLNPAAIDMEPFALLRALEISLEPDIFNKTFALVNIGASVMSINIYKAGVLRQSRTVKVAGNRFTEVIAQALNISFDEAEKMKKEKGVIRVAKDAAPVAPTTMRIFNVIVPVLVELITEIQRSFDYYKKRYQDESIGYIALSGGTALFKNIDAYISNELGITCGVLNPFKKIDISKVPGVSPDMLQELAPSLTIAVGLGLRNI